jgi:raffinose/stachyose/melibiose transport system permease protein
MATTTYSQSRWNGKRAAQRFFQYLILVIIAAIVLIPVVMLIFAALKTRGELMSSPYTLPIPPRWENLISILGSNRYSFWTMLRNSLVIMLTTTFLVVAICSLAAFVFSRMNFRGKTALFNLFTLGLMFPISIAILPVYFVLRQMHQLDTFWGVILVQTAFLLSGNILILRGFFSAIPLELQDAAYIDGCSTFDFFWRILLPLSRPSLAAVAALTMIASWNDILIPLVVINSDKLWPLPLGTMQFQGQYGQDLSLVSAFVLVSAVPTIIFYLFAERQIISGLTAGAIKG